MFGRHDRHHVCAKDIRKNEWEEMDEWTPNKWPNETWIDADEKLCRLCSARNLQFKVIEIGDGIGFRPESDTAG